MTPSREELLRSIQPGMKLTRDFFKRIYGYELTWPGFAEIALQRLEILGCGLARQHYDRITAEIKEEFDKGMKEAAAWYAEECRKKWDRKVDDEIRIRKESLRLLRQNSKRN